MSLFRFLFQVQAMGTAFAAERVVNFVLVLVLARGLGSEGFGLYATALSVAGLLEYLLEMGIGPVVTRRAAQDPGRVRSWLLKVVLLKGALVVA
ncbi:MAG: oligosaccharide flippase family protein, partial [Nitrospirae bacterium]|nr:oligosaccharide flippase family protein [Nitrospirota bacterium]